MSFIERVTEELAAAQVFVNNKTQQLADEKSRLEWLSIELHDNRGQMMPDGYWEAKEQEQWELSDRIRRTEETLRLFVDWRDGLRSRLDKANDLAVNDPELLGMIDRGLEAGVEVTL